MVTIACVCVCCVPRPQTYTSFSLLAVRKMGTASNEKLVGMSLGNYSVCVSMYAHLV